jgi:Uma2 family endonuclease
MDVVQLRRWTRQEYEHLAELGVIGPAEQVELIEGEIVEVPPQHSRHAVGVRLAEDALRARYGVGFDVRGQLPLALGPYSEPEPDVAVVIGAARDYAEAHPSTALLVVEVAEATLSFDRDRKSGLYAAAGIPEYWVVNLVQRQVEIYREPSAMPETPSGFGYRTRTIMLPGEFISAPTPAVSPLAVDDLLP